MTRQTLSKWEDDKIVPNIENINQMTLVFDVSPLYFFDKEVTVETIQTKDHLFFMLIILIAILSWYYPRLVVLNFIELFIFRYKINIHKHYYYALIGICIFYLITFIFYPEVYIKAFEFYYDCRLK